MAFERRILTRYDASTAGFDRGTRRVEQQLARLQRTADRRLASIDQRFARAGRAALQFGAAIGGLALARGIGEVRQYAEAWRGVERSLTSAGFAVEGNREKLAQLAIRVRGDLASTGQAVARFARVTGDDLDTSIRRVETLRKLLAVGGATTAEAGSATLQLTQGLRSGQLGGEELRAIREAAPVEFLDALARRAGGTRAELKQLGAEAKLTADVITGALDDLAAQADADFAKLAINGSEAFEILATGFSAFFGNLDQELGATAGINEFLSDMGNLLNDNAEAARTFAQALEVAATAAVALTAGAVGGRVTSGLRANAAARQEVVRAAQQEVAASRAALVAAQQTAVARQAAVATAKNQTSALKSVASANIALTAAQERAVVATQTLSAAQAQLSAVTRLSARAMGVLRGALAFFGGVPGLIITAVSAMVLFSDEIFGAAEAAETFDGAMQTLDASIAAAESRARQLAETERALEQDTEALTAANDRLKGAIEAGEAAAVSAASTEISAINSRIAANEALRQKYIQVLQAQRVALQADLQSTQRQFRGEFGGSFVDQADTGAVVQAALLSQSADKERAMRGLRELAAETKNVTKLQAEAIEQAREQAVRAVNAGTATEEQVAFLGQDADLQARELQVQELASNIESLLSGAVEATAGPTTSGVDVAGAAGGGGGSGRAAREVPNILEGQQASNQALAEELAISERVLRMREGLIAAGLDMEDVNQQVASASERLTAILERNRIEQELLKRAQEEGVEITPQLRAEISGLADDYLRLTLAQQGVQEAEQRLAETQREAEELAEARGQAISDLGDRFTNLIQGAESLEDALKKVAIELANLVAQAIAGEGPLAALFGGSGGGGFGGILGSIFGGGGSSAGSFGSLLSTPSSQLPVVRFHKGGVVGRGGTLAGSMPAELFAHAPRLHSGGIIGPNEVPAILERGEIVVPKNIGMGRSAPSVTIGDTNISITEPGMTEAQLQRTLAENRRKTVEDVQRLWAGNPDAFQGS